MTDPSQLTSLQLAVMNILWDAGEVSVNDVLSGLESERALAFTTVATILSRLEKRGVVERRREGRQFLYRALVEREEARRDKVDELARDLFEGKVSRLVHHLLTRSEVDGGELQRVKELIAAREAEVQRAQGQDGGETQ